MSCWSLRDELLLTPEDDADGDDDEAEDEEDKDDGASQPTALALQLAGDAVFFEAETTGVSTNLLLADFGGDSFSPEAFLFKSLPCRFGVTGADRPSSA